MPDHNDIRVIYLSSFEYPSRHGHPLHALSMARAFSSLLGEQFLFVVGKCEKEELSGVARLAPFGALFGLVKAFGLRSFALKLWLSRFLRARPEWRTNLTIFTNDLKLAAAANSLKEEFGFRVIAEVHGSAGEEADAKAIQADRLIFVTEGLKRRFTGKYPACEGKSAVMPNAIALEEFDRADAKGVREELGIPTESTVVGYVGRFRPMESDKGVDFMIDALTALPDKVSMLFVGGTDGEIAEARKRAGREVRRAFFVPFVPFDVRTRYMKAVDILAYVPPKEDRFLSEETSPMKLYEYMAARKPIIASDMPAFREALGENAWLIAPGSLEEFVSAVGKAHPEDPRVSRAYERVSGNTWLNRARAILGI